MTTPSLLDQPFDRAKYSTANPAPWETLKKIKGARFCEYRALLKKAEACEILTDVPVEVHLKTTLNCNHRCHKCLHGTGVFPSGPAYNMSFDTVKKILDEGKAKGLRSVLWAGGELFVHPEIRKFIEYAHALDFDDVSLFTNGALMDRATSEHLIQHGITRINVSVDAFSPETYRRVHGVDEFDLVMQNIRDFLDARARLGSPTPLLAVSFVLSEENMHELDPFYEHFAPLADGSIKVFPYKNVFSIVDERFCETYGKGPKDLSELDLSELPTHLARKYAIVNNYDVQCTTPWYRCHIGINGEVQACTTQGFADHPDMVMGNIHERSFEEIWKSEPWELLRQITRDKEFHRHPVCKLCQRSVS